MSKSISKGEVIRGMVRARLSPKPEEDRSGLFPEILKEMLRLDLTEPDARWFFERMERDRWMFCGVPVLDWRQAIKILMERAHFPSQRR